MTDLHVMDGVNPATTLDKAEKIKMKFNRTDVDVAAPCAGWKPAWSLPTFDLNG